LFSKEFTHLAPTTLKTGTPTRKSKDRSILRDCTRGNLSFASLIQPKILTAIIMLFNVIIRGSNDNGFEIPSVKPISLTIKPAIIRNARLNPAENRIVSMSSKFSKLSKRKKIKPGTNVRYMKPMTCLAIVMSKKTTRQNINCNKRTINNKVFEF